MNISTRYIASCPHCAFTCEYHPDVLEGAVEVFALHLRHFHQSTGHRGRADATKAFVDVLEAPELKRDPEGITA